MHFLDLFWMTKSYPIKVTNQLKTSNCKVKTKHLNRPAPETWTPDKMEVSVVMNPNEHLLESGASSKANAMLLTSQSLLNDRVVCLGQTDWLNLFCRIRFVCFNA